MPSGTYIEQDPGFAIIPSSVSNILYRNNSFIVAAHSSSGTITPAAGGSWSNPTLRFAITPNPRNGTSTEDRTAIYYTVGNIDATIYNQYRLIQKPSKSFLAAWSEDGETLSYVSGSRSIRYLETATLDLELTVNQVGMSFMEVGYTITVYVNFSSTDDSWTASYPIDFMVVRKV